MIEHLITRMALRPARPEDFDYCARLYFDGMDDVIKELKGNNGHRLVAEPIHTLKSELCNLVPLRRHGEEKEHCSPQKSQGPLNSPRLT